LDLYVILALSVAGAFLVGLYGERWRARLARNRWRARQGGKPGRADVVPFGKTQKPVVADAPDQLRVVMRASFEKRRLMSKAEARVFYLAEDVVREQRLNWRVMAQVSLGEVLASPGPEAYRAINSKRVDILLVSNAGEPVAAIEFQGGGHHQGEASARDAVKKEALRRAGVGYIEVTPDHDREYLSGEIARTAKRVRGPGRTSSDVG
jgi:uncharacterized protein DUF2726